MKTISLLFLMGSLLVSFPLLSKEDSAKTDRSKAPILESKHEKQKIKTIGLHHKRRKHFRDREHLTKDWSGIRSEFEKLGFYLDSFFTLDVNWPTGGFETSSKPLFQYLYELNCQWRPEELLKYEGGTVYLSFQYHGGAHPTKDYVQDFLFFDSISARNLTQLGELWYQQDFFKEKLFLKLGKIDAVENFQFTKNAVYLVNASYETIPTIVGFPTYPNPASGVIIGGEITSFLKLSAGILDGSNAIGVNTGSLGPSTFFNNLGDHAFIISEAHVNWKGSYAGDLMIGGWGNTITTQRFNGQNQNGVGGGYVLLDQTVYPGKGKESQWQTGMFLQYGFTNPEVSESAFFLGGGTASHNVLDKGVLEDYLSLGVAYVQFSNAKGTNYKYPFEMSIEATYWMQIIDWLEVQPDIQYIIHPSGTHADSFVFTLRLNVDI